MKNLLKNIILSIMLFGIIDLANGQIIESKLTNDAINYHHSILNTTLVGVRKIDEQREPNYNNLVIDINSICLCNAPSFYIDTTKKQFYAINFCAGEYSKDLKESYLSTKINKIVVDSIKLVLYISSNDQSNVVFTFTKVKTDIYKLVIEGELNRDYIGNQIYNFYIPNNSLYKVKKEECDDYEG